MPRRARHAPGGLIYHVLNRGNGRQDIFHSDADAAAFLRVVKEAKALIPMRLLAFCLMSNRAVAATRRRPVALHVLAEHK